MTNPIRLGVAAGVVVVDSGVKSAIDWLGLVGGSMELVAQPAASSAIAAVLTIHVTLMLPRVLVGNNANHNDTTPQSRQRRRSWEEEGANVRLAVRESGD